MSTRLSRAFIVVVALGSVATLSAGCSTRSGSASKSDVGSIGLALQLSSGATLNSVAYTITGPSSFSRTGTIDTSHSSTLSTVIGGIPAGVGFSIVLDGTATDGATHCSSVATMFDVAAHMTTAVSVNVSCHQPPRTGSVLVNGHLNLCPTVDGLSASPAEVLVGSSIALAVTAHDDGGPAALAYHWTATAGGALSAVDVPSPSLSCTAAGTVTVSVTATDGDCSDTMSATVTCTAGATGAGGGGGAGGATGGSGGAAGSAGAGGGSVFTTMDLSKYVRIARYDLPEPTRTMPPDGVSLLAQEASTVTYDWDTDTLFVVGDGGTSVVQVTKTGVLIDSMTLAPGGSPQGTEFYDTEGVSYVGGGKFVMTEERYRQAVLFTYAAGTTLHRTDAQTVKLGTTIGNIGLEGVTWDPSTGNYIFVKEKEPEGIFLTSIDWAAGTASNGSPTTDESVNLFDPSLVGTLDFSDVFALSNIPSLTGDPTFSQLLILSQESGEIVQIDRSGNVKHRLALVADPSDTIAIPDMTIEGITMDRAGFLYLASEDGGGDANHPQLWVYAPSTAANQAPTAVSLTGAVTSLPDNTSTAADVHLADVHVTDDGLGDNTLAVAGADAASFKIVGTALFLKAGTALNAATKSSYSISVTVDDVTVGGTPDASTPYTLAITAGGAGGPITLAVTEVAPWSSGNSPASLAADWFELTNFGTSAVSLAGWTMDDNSSSFAVSVALNGITSIAPSESVIFIETATASASDLAAKAQAFINLWFNGAAPAGLQIGNYSGSGVGLSTGGDAVNIFDNGGTLHAAASFPAIAAGPPFATFDNSAGLNNVVISATSVVGQNGAFAAPQDTNEIGSPGTVGGGGTPIVGITATDATASETGPDPGVFHFTRSGSTTSPLTVVYAIATGAGQATPDDYTPALGGSQVIPAGASSVDVTITPVDDALVEGAETLTLTLSDTGSYDVGANASASITIQDNDAANLAPTAVTLTNTVTSLSDGTSTSSHVRVADISVTDDGLGTNDLSVSGTDAASFEIVGSSLYLKAGTVLGHASKPTLSVTVAVDDPSVGATPDATTAFTLTVTAAVPPGSIVISEIAPYSSSVAPLSADWFEVTNTGATTIDMTGWKMDDNSHSFASAVPMSGITTIAPGEAVIFIETSNLASAAATFTSLWFGSGAARVPQIGSYSGSGVGLSSSGDEVTLWDASGNLVAGVGFGAAAATAPFATFDNHAGGGGTTIPLPAAITTFSAAGTNGAFVAAGDSTQTGSPGVGNVGKLLITEVAPWGSSTAGYAADWFEVTNVGGAAVDMTGYRMDDNSNSFASSVPINGVGSVAPGQSVVLIEGTATTASNFVTTWFGAGGAPAGFVIGTYSGSGVGLSATADAVNVFTATGTLVANVSFNASTSNVSFDNAAGLNNALISTLSASGVHGAFNAANDGAELGSPGKTH
jgi:uncharacterized protein YjiK